MLSVSEFECLQVIRPIAIARSNFNRTKSSLNVQGDRNRTLPSETIQLAANWTYSSIHFNDKKSCRRRLSIWSSLMTICKRQQQTRVISAASLRISRQSIDRLKPIDGDGEPTVDTVRTDIADKTDPFINCNFESPRFYAIFSWSREDCKFSSSNLKNERMSFYRTSKSTGQMHFRWKKLALRTRLSDRRSTRLTGSVRWISKFFLINNVDTHIDTRWFA